MSTRKRFGGGSSTNRAGTTTRREAPSSSGPGTNGRAFEKRVADRLHDMGWDVRLTPASGDFGADVVATCGRETLVVQCKQWASAVGFDAVKEVVFGRIHHKANLAVVIADGAFTRAAEEAARSADVHLLRWSDLLHGVHLDRSVEGKRIRAAREAQHREAEEKRRRQQTEALEQKNRREAEERASAIAAQWSDFDRRFAAYAKSLAGRKSKLAYIGFASLLAIPVIVWAFDRNPVLTVIGAVIAIWGSLAYVQELFSLIKPQPPSASRPSVSSTGKVEVRCSRCTTRMRLPAGRSGTVVCPTCTHRFICAT